jgi:hypothetical protein
LNLLQRFIRWFSTPQSSKEIDPRNFRYVQIDAIGVGLANAAAQFPAYVLTRLDATTNQIGLLTSMPGVTGLLLSIPLGQFLQRKKNIVPWFSLARLLVISSYAFTGFALFLTDSQVAIKTILMVWALATIPQTVLAISFTVVMNAVAGPKGRYELMTRRWSILSLTTLITSIGVIQIVDRFIFPVNYQIVFLILSVGGLMSYYFSSHLIVPDSPVIESHSHNWREGVSDYVHLITKEKPFLSFTLKRFVFLTGVTLAAPLYPVYYIRVLDARDSWLAAMNMISTFVIVLGYFFWIRQSRLRGTRFVLLTTTLGTCFFPILVSTTKVFWPVWIFVGINAIFSAGLNLVFFDELMKTIPERYSASFVAAAQSIQYISAIIAPSLGTFLSANIGFQFTFLISGAISFCGFLLFAFEKKKT